MFQFILELLTDLLLNRDDEPKSLKEEAKSFVIKRIVKRLLGINKR